MGGRGRGRKDEMRRGGMGMGKAYRALKLQCLEVGGMVWLEFYGAVVEGCEERFGEGEFGHFLERGMLGFLV